MSGNIKIFFWGAATKGFLRLDELGERVFPHGPIMRRYVKFRLLPAVWK